MLAALLTLSLRGQDLRLRVVEGEGIIYPVGSRSARGVTVEVTDAAGVPVSGATVSFLLPDHGPSGTFPSGSRTEIDTTAADGRAEAWGMRWNREPGPVEIRIVAAKGPQRAGVVAQVTLTSALGAKAPAQSRQSASGGHKWLWITLAAVGAAGAGVATTGLSGKTSASAPPAAVIRPTIIGTPTINLERP